MPLKIFRENFVNRLRGSIAENLPSYRFDESWIDDLPGRTHETTIEPTEELNLREPDGDDLKDIENAIHLHRALSFLTPLQARDPRLWTRLTHVEGWQYMRKRWGMERFGRDKGKAERFVVSRYFVAQNQSRALLRNGLARLWWYGYLTFDLDRENPYELTGVLLSRLDITQQLLERNFGRIASVTNGFLEFLLRNKNRLLGAGDEKRVRIRELAKHLNLRGGITLLDSFDKSGVIELLENEFARIDAARTLTTATV